MQAIPRLIEENGIRTLALLRVEITLNSHFPPHSTGTTKNFSVAEALLLKHISVNYMPEVEEGRAHKMEYQKTKRKGKNEVGMERKAKRGANMDGCLMRERYT